jgi:hypothetical protein
VTARRRRRLRIAGLIAAVLAGVFLFACFETARRPAPQPHKTWKPSAGSKPAKPKHRSHEHAHGSHPHESGDHHHHPHPHPHLAGAHGHHHPY